MSIKNSKEELLNSQINAGNQSSDNSQSSKNHPLRERIEIDNTPFLLVGNEEDGYFLTIGRLRVTEGGETKEELLRRLEVRDWELIINLILGFAEAVKHYGEDLPEVLPVTKATTDNVMTKQERSIVAQAVEQYRKDHPDVNVVKV